MCKEQQTKFFLALVFLLFRDPAAYWVLVYLNLCYS